MSTYLLEARVSFNLLIPSILSSERFFEMTSFFLESDLFLIYASEDNTGPLIFFRVLCRCSLSRYEVESVLAELIDVFDIKLLLFSSVALFFFLAFFLGIASRI